MMKLFPDEIAGFIPGVKPVMQLLPCDQEVTTTTTVTPARTEYAITADRTFVEGKTYYVIENNLDGTTSYVAATVTVGDSVPDEHYFEKYEVAAVNATTTVIYERYTQGKYPVKFEGNIVKLVEHPVEIRKTTTMETTAGDVKTTTIARYHGLGLWAKRAEIEYVPLCDRLEQNSLGESARMF